MKRTDLIMAWLQQQSTRERLDTFKRTAIVRTSSALPGRSRSYIFAALSDHLDLWVAFRHRFPQSCVLLLELLLAPRLVGLERPERFFQVQMP